jgi:uncharacterized protein YdaU (DUF1376 family)
MGKDPAFLFYYQDYMVGTRRLSREQKGAYVDLLCEQADMGHLSIEDIKSCLGEDFNLWESIKKKFVPDESNLFYNVRLDEELKKRRAFSESRRKNIQKRYESSTSVDTSVVTKDDTNELHMENENRNRNKDVFINSGEEDCKEKISDKAEKIYEAYPRKVGRKAAIDKIAKALKNMDFEILMGKVNEYAASVKDKEIRFIPHPATWFYQERYKDPIEKDEPLKPTRALYEYERSAASKYDNV